MKYAREIKVGALATICLFLLFFGFNYLKGVNIFSPTNSYHGVYTHLHGMEEQAAVYIRGHKVGQVDAIHYDFAKDSSFTVDISVKRDISLPEGTRMALVADGLLGGMAIELQLPSSDGQQPAAIAKGSFLPTTYVPGLFESVQNDLLAHVDEAIQEVDSLVAQVRAQIAGNHLQATLENVDRISGDLTYVSADIKQLMQTKVPTIVNNADTAVANLNVIVADLKQADLKATVARVDTAVDGINSVIADVREQKGTLGQLLYNKSLYDHIDATVITADSLLTDLKAHPKRYVHFSLFGKKDK
jgi:phospholipid/cholesterol/gamma-HCH transport system substrate-binding protein